MRECRLGQVYPFGSLDQTIAAAHGKRPDLARPLATVDGDGPAVVLGQARQDCAQAPGARYKGRRVGTFGDFGCFSFHETKNFICWEGGALLIRDPALIERATGEPPSPEPLESLLAARDPVEPTSFRLAVAPVRLAYEDPAEL